MRLSALNWSATRVLWAWVLGFGSLALSAAEPESLAIQGYDTVAYFTEGRALRGDPRYTLTWDEHRWQFASAEHRSMFKADPVRFAPQFANFCAVALAQGEVKAANPEYWLISEGRLYLFGKSVGPSLFKSSLERNIELANQHRDLIRRAQ